MKILVLSDSHQASLEELDFTSYDRVYHCGDYGKSEELLVRNQIHYVRGNCDLSGLTERIEDLFGKKIYITHGHRYDVKYGIERLIYRALELEVKVCMFGHTHQQTCFELEGILFLNPGSYPYNYIEITEEEIHLYRDGKSRRFKYRW